MTSIDENLSNHMTDTGFEAIPEQKDILPKLTNSMYL